MSPGEIVGLVGENGSGKSTLMKVLVGDLAADSGTLDRTESFGYCPQVPVLYERLTCDEHLDLFGAAYSLAPGDLVRSREALYKDLDFVRFADTRVEELSGGTRSKLNLALAMLHDPALLCLDEPYAGFDWDTYERFWELTAVRRSAGASLLIISHFIADEERFDRIYDLIDGRNGAAMTLALAVRWLVEYARRPLNLALLVAIPVIFVTLSAGALTDFADILGGVTDLGEVEAATAGWAAAVLAGVAGFFHVSTSRDADRRLAGAGTGARRVVASRLASTLVLAGLAAIGALIALRLRTTGLAFTPRVVGATLLFALIYAGIGVTVGALVRSEMNGSLIVVFTWIFDVFFGPAMGNSAPIIRVFPLHFPTLVVTDVASGHSGRLGDLGLAVMWALLTTVMAATALTLTTRTHRHHDAPIDPRRPSNHGSADRGVSTTSTDAGDVGADRRAPGRVHQRRRSRSRPTTRLRSSWSKGAAGVCRSCRWPMSTVR